MQNSPKVFPKYADKYYKERKTGPDDESVN